MPPEKQLIPLLTVDWQATLKKWQTAISLFNLNISEIARNCKITRQHVTAIIGETSTPSMPVAERLDREIDAAVERRRDSARKLLSILGAEREVERLKDKGDRQ